MDCENLLALLAAVSALSPPLGAYIARVMSGERTFLQPVLGPVEHLLQGTGQLF